MTATLQPLCRYQTCSSKCWKGPGVGRILSEGLATQQQVLVWRSLRKHLHVMSLSAELAEQHSWAPEGGREDEGKGEAGP